MPTSCSVALRTPFIQCVHGAQVVRLTRGPQQEVLRRDQHFAKYLFFFLPRAVGVTDGGALDSKPRRASASRTHGGRRGCQGQQVSARRSAASLTVERAVFSVAAA